MASVIGADYGPDGEKIRIYYSNGVVKEKVRNAGGFRWVEKTIEQLEQEKKARRNNAVIAIVVIVLMLFACAH